MLELLLLQIHVLHCVLPRLRRILLLRLFRRHLLLRLVRRHLLLRLVRRHLLLRLVRRHLLLRLVRMRLPLLLTHLLKLRLLVHLGLLRLLRLLVHMLRLRLLRLPTDLLCLLRLLANRLHLLRLLANLLLTKRMLRVLLLRVWPDWLLLHLGLLPCLLLKPHVDIMMVLRHLALLAMLALLPLRLLRRVALLGLLLRKHGNDEGGDVDDLFFAGWNLAASSRVLRHRTCGKWLLRLARSVLAISVVWNLRTLRALHTLCTLRHIRVGHVRIGHVHIGYMHAGHVRVGHLRHMLPAVKLHGVGHVAHRPELPGFNQLAKLALLIRILRGRKLAALCRHRCLPAV